MVSPYFEGAKSISGLGLPRFLGFGPGLGAETWWLDPNLGQKVAWEGPKSWTVFSVWTITFAPLGV